LEEFLGWLTNDPKAKISWAIAPSVSLKEPQRGDPLATKKFKRKLTAIPSADVKGYSRLMGEDKEGTISTLNATWES